MAAGRPPPPARATASADLRALSALIAGAAIIGVSPILVRLSEVGPMTTAFWRVALALPVLMVWSVVDARPARVHGLCMSRASSQLCG